MDAEDEMCQLLQAHQTQLRNHPCQVCTQVVLASSLTSRLRNLFLHHRQRQVNHRYIHRVKVSFSKTSSMEGCRPCRLISHRAPACPHLMGVLRHLDREEVLIELLPVLTHRQDRLLLARQLAVEMEHVVSYVAYKISSARVQVKEPPTNLGLRLCTIES